jgi:hypothetical protein
MEQDATLLPSYTPRPRLHTGKMRYAVMDGSKRYDTQLSAMLGMLGAGGYEAEIRELLLGKKYKGRLSESDKVLSAVFYVLRRNSHPIDYQDVVPYTHRTKKEFIKIIMREYDFSGVNEEYLLNLLSRAREYLRTMKFERRVEFEVFKRVVETNRSFSPHVICIALHVQGAELEKCYERLKLDKFCSRSALKRALTKVRCMSL